MLNASRPGPKHWLGQLKRDRRLRALQQKYYEANATDEATILEYMRLLADARREELTTLTWERPPVALHVGCGGHYLRGWLNSDVTFAPPIDIVFDATLSLPFGSSSVDYIHSEDFIEHVELPAGKRFISEAHRILRPGGVMRLLTPDLRALIKNVYVRKDAAHLRWCEAFLSARGPCEALNMHMRMNGEHRFIYDEPFLVDLLAEVGFEVRRVSYNSSPQPFLRYLDLRNFRLNLFLEGVKRVPA